MNALSYERALKRNTPPLRKSWEDWMRRDFPDFTRYAVLTHPWNVSIEKARNNGFEFIETLESVLFESNNKRLILLFTIEDGHKLRDKPQNPHLNFLLYDHPKLDNLLIQKSWDKVLGRRNVNIKIESIPDEIPLEKALSYTLKEVNHERVPEINIPCVFQYYDTSEPTTYNAVKSPSISPEPFLKPTETQTPPLATSNKSRVIFPISIRTYSTRKRRKKYPAFRASDLDFLSPDVKLTGNVRICKLANGRWYVRFKLNGKRLFLATGETDEARALLKISEVVKRAEQKASQPSTGKTFSDLNEEYTSYALTNKESSTVYRDKSRMKVLLAYFGKTEIAEISTKDIEQYMQERSKKIKPASVNRELALFRHMLSKAVDWCYLDSNPAKKVKPFKEPPGRIRYLSDGERERLLDSCSGMLKDLVLVAILTGMRKGELQGLTWDDVNFEEEVITLRKTKNNELRIIPISKELLPVLHGLRDSMPYAHHVFSKPDGSPYGNWRKAFETACTRAGVKNFRFHDLRHTFASYIAMSGHNAFTIQALTGHKTLSMVQRYTHLSNEYLRSAVDEIGEKVVKPSKKAIDDFVS